MKTESAEIQGSVHLPQTDCLVEIGHTIVRGPQGNWFPSPLLQRVVEEGIAEKDGFRKYKRTGIWEQVSPDATDAIVGGGVWSVAATVDVYTSLARENHAPKVVVHTGGRAGYLDALIPDDPTITEGRVNYEAFNRRLEGNLRGLAWPNQEIIETSRTTRDDMQCGLETAIKYRAEHVVFVALEVRLGRCQRFVEELQADSADFRQLQVSYIAADDILRDVAERRGRSAQMEKVLEQFYSSAGYLRTREAEDGGIKASLAGTYGQTTGGIGNT